MKSKKYIDWNQRLDEAMAECRKKCKCGHTVIVPYSSKYDYVLCNWCNSRVYRDNKKQSIYDSKVEKDNFMYNLNKSIEEAKKRENIKMRNINRKNLKRKYFKNNTEYFNFCKNMNITIYIVNMTNSGNIVVYYGAKLGRPITNNETKRAMYNNRRKKNFDKHSNNTGEHYDNRGNKKTKSGKSH